MSKTIIEVIGLSKRYKYGQTVQPYYTLRDTLTGIFKSPKEFLPRSVKSGGKGDFWALKDVSFEVNEGEVLGIIGPNGSGKSTLLKILSQITPPTKGEVIMRGRVGSLLEVGTGFHQELTGRENIYLNGAILGMGRKEIKRKFDEIVDFSGIENFLDTPVKRYSSGMMVRLGFAVAAHLDPEILLIDEVLAVGDAEFQKKCLKKMGDVAKGGRTILFVSHNLESVKNLCPKSIMLKKGEIVLSGDTNKVINFYTKSISKVNEFKRQNDKKSEIFINKVAVLGEGGKERTSFNADEKITIRTELIFNNYIKNSVIGVVITTLYGLKLFTAQIEIHKPEGNNMSKEVKYDLTIPAMFLNKNGYNSSVYIHLPNQKVIDLVENCASFDIIGTSMELGTYSRPEEAGLVLGTGCVWTVT